MKSLSLLLSLIISILYSSLHALPTGISQAIEVLQGPLHQLAVPEAEVAASVNAVKAATAKSNVMVNPPIRSVRGTGLWAIEDFTNKEFMATPHIGYFDMDRFGIPPIKMKTEKGVLLMENAQRQWIRIPQEVLNDPHEGFLPQFFLIKYTA